MKTTILKFLLSLICISFVITLNAQDPYFCVKKGAKLEYVRTCPKGDIIGYSETVILDVQENIEKGDTLGTIKFTLNLLDENGEPETSEPIEQTITYTNGSFSINMAESMSAIINMTMDEMMGEQESEEKDEEIMERINKMIKISGEPTIFPSDMKPGDELEDSSCSFRILVMRMRISVTDRMVIKEEKITTDAGMYSCMVLQESIREKGMGENNQTKTITWYSRGVGAIKTETYDKKGKLESVEVLSSLVL